MLYFHFLCAKKISKYNMINMISKPGIFYKRRCDETEIEKVKEAYEKTKHHLDKITNATAWFNFVTSKVYHVDMSEKYYQDFELWVRSLVDEISGKDKYIHSYGFLFSPKHSTHTQSYHMDTYPDIQGIFIPMVHLTTQNSTRYLTTPPKSKPFQGINTDCRFGYSDLQLLEKQEADCIEVAQVICKPYVILQLNKSTVHRGIPNSTDIDRPMFFVFCSPTEETNFPKDAVLSEEKNLVKSE